MSIYICTHVRSVNVEITAMQPMPHMGYLYIYVYLCIYTYIYVLIYI